VGGLPLNGLLMDGGSGGGGAMLDPVFEGGPPEVGAAGPMA